MPRDPAVLFRLPAYEYAGSAADALGQSSTRSSFPLPPRRQEWEEPLRLVGCLSSRVAEREAQPALNRCAFSPLLPASCSSRWHLLLAVFVFVCVI